MVSTLLRSPFCPSRLSLSLSLSTPPPLPRSLLSSKMNAGLPHLRGDILQQHVYSANRRCAHSHRRINPYSIMYPPSPPPPLPPSILYSLSLFSFLSSLIPRIYQHQLCVSAPVVRWHQRSLSSRLVRQTGWLDWYYSFPPLSPLLLLCLLCLSSASPPFPPSPPSPLSSTFIPTYFIISVW